MNDAERLARCLCQDFPSVTPSADRAWFREPALRVIDCVLSLCRNYDRFVVPRLDRFEAHFPSTRSVQALRDQMDTHNDAADLEFAQGSTGRSELERLERWASQARPDGYQLRRIRGFALAGYQYLRMLFGANTTKPDVHICRYVSRAIGRTVSDLEALSLLEGASDISGVRLRDLDTTIWEASARLSA